MCQNYIWKKKLPMTLERRHASLTKHQLTNAARTMLSVHEIKSLCISYHQKE